MRREEKCVKLTDFIRMQFPNPVKMQMAEARGNDASVDMIR